MQAFLKYKGLSLLLILEKQLIKLDNVGNLYMQRVYNIYNLLYDNIITKSPYLFDKYNTDKSAS